MRLIDADALVFYYGGLSKISHYDGRGIAKYFMDQVKAAPTFTLPEQGGTMKKEDVYLLDIDNNLALETKIVNALKRSGYKTIGDIIDGIISGRIYSVRCLGPKSVSKIANYLLDTYPEVTGDIPEEITVSNTPSETKTCRYCCGDDSDWVYEDEIAFFEDYVRIRTSAFISGNHLVRGSDICIYNNGYELKQEETTINFCPFCGRKLEESQ